MSATHSTLFNRRACGLWIAGVFVLVAIHFGCSGAPPSPDTDAAPVLRQDTARPTSGVFDAEALKRTIIANNLFRPLGWTPPRPVEPYRLMGTILPRSENTPPKAIIQTTAGDRTYIVTTGEKIDASTEVVSIEGKQVTLSTDGQQRTLRLRSVF